MNDQKIVRCKIHSGIGCFDSLWLPPANGRDYYQRARTGSASITSSSIRLLS
jgi:hypothetical protein